MLRRGLWLPRALGVAAHKGRVASVPRSFLWLGALVPMPAQQTIPFIKVALPTAKGLVFFTLANLLYFEADDKACVLCYQEKGTIKTVTVFKGIAVLERKLSQHGFLLVRREILINTFHIQVITTDKTLVMTDGKTIHPSFRKIRQVETYIEKHFGI